MNARLILIALMVVLALPVQAQDRTYNSVEEIIRETRFRIVDLETYRREIKTGKVVGFFFHSTIGLDGPTGLLAKVFKETMRPYTGLKFIALPENPNVRGQRYIDLGFTHTPAYAFYKDGKRVFGHNAGPANDEEYRTEIQTMRGNLKELEEMN